MNGRTRIQAAFSPEGTPEIGAVIPYESIFIRDHWDSLSDKPWWVRAVPDTSVARVQRYLELAHYLGKSA